MMGPLADRLRQAGYKLTAPRLAVLQVLETGGPLLTPTEVLARGRAIYPTLSRATVYRTLDLLNELGVFRPIYLGDKGSHVAYVEGGHHHLVCLHCGSVIHFDECLIGELEHTLTQRFSFQIKSHMLELYGLCESCRK
jgi:Fur family ferric uptake transcriptional regulator